MALIREPKLGPDQEQRLVPPVQLRGFLESILSDFQDLRPGPIILKVLDFEPPALVYASAMHRFLPSDPIQHKETISTPFFQT